MSTFEMSARDRLLAHADEINPSIVAVLEEAGDPALDAYASAQVQHNTLSNNVPSVLEHGLVPGHVASTPDEEDIAFARELLQRKEFYSPQRERKFDIYIAGTKGDRPPGVFLSVITKSSQDTHNQYYGIPERSMILMTEMGAVMLGGAAFDARTRARAADIYDKYRERLYKDNHVSVLEVDPFSPPVINERLSGLASVSEGMDAETLAMVLPVAGSGLFEGLYIPELIPAKDIRATEITEPMPSPPSPPPNLQQSRFYSQR